MYDIVIIGAGVIGSCIARELSKYDMKIALVDAATEVAMGTSRANSAIVHAGYDCTPGSLMAKMNVRGNELFTKWCEELEVPLKRTGSLVLGFNDRDDEILNELKEKGERNEVPGLEIISADKIIKMLPAVNPAVKSALYAPTGGITCPYELTLAAAENAEQNGVEMLLNFKIVSIDNGVLTAEDGRSVSARLLINAAGIFADEIARMAGDDSFSIHPRKGEYMLFDKTVGNLVNMVVFQTPNEFGKGVVVSGTAHGNIYAGPTGVDITDKYDKDTTLEGLVFIREKGKLSVPSIPWNKVITSFAGLRAVADTQDFIIGLSKAGYMINAAGICSPGLSSAPAIAEYVEKLCIEFFGKLTKKTGFNPYRKAIRRFSDMTDDEKSAAIINNPLYAHIICRCEMITEAEIVEAVKRGASTIDGVKLRTRAGMGRCQGGFCSPKIIGIISREKGVEMETVTKFGGNSYILTGKLREV